MSLESSAPDPTHDVDALLLDVQRLLHSYQVLQSENTRLKLTIQEQNQRFSQAQSRIAVILKQLPSLAVAETLIEGL